MSAGDGKCTACGLPAHTQVMVPTSLSGVDDGSPVAFASLGVMCSKCRSELVKDIASGKLHRDGPFFAQIETGVKMPAGVLVHQGGCKQCGRVGEIVGSVLEVPQLGRGARKNVCAECVADIVAGLKVAGFGKLYLETAPGTFNLADSK